MPSSRAGNGIRWSPTAPSAVAERRRRVLSLAWLGLFTVVLAQVLDFATFTAMVERHGTIAEGNPIVRALFEAQGMPAVALAKLAVLVEVTGLVLAARAHRGRGIWLLVGGLPVAVAIVAGLIGGLTNVLSFHG